MQTLHQQGCMDYVFSGFALPQGPLLVNGTFVLYTAAALGGYFMHQGRDVLIIFDDLTKHSWVCGQMSLCWGDLPGVEEAYPETFSFYILSLWNGRGA